MSRQTPATTASTSLRPREKSLERGLHSLSEGELISLLLGTGCRGEPVEVLAERLLSALGGLGGLDRCSPRQLARHLGLGIPKALRLIAALELGRRALAEQARPRTHLGSGNLVADFAGPRLGHLLHEELWVLTLDGRNHLRSFRRVSQGGLHGCGVMARDILRVGLEDAASSLVLVHNHPSGDPTPSVEDLKMTAAVSLAAEVIGVPLVDHVVVAPGGRFASMLERGELPRPLDPLA